MEKQLKDPELPQNDYSAFKSIFDLLDFLIKSQTSPDITISLISQINRYLNTGEKGLSAADTLHIIKLNVDFATKYKQTYQQKIDKSRLLLYCLNALSLEITSSKISKMYVQIIETLIPVYNKADPIQKNVC